MVIDESWGVSIERARAFFREQPDAAERAGQFFCGGCAVTLTPGEDVLAGQWPIPRTRLQIEGPEEAARAVYRRFFLRFLSAGG